MNDSTQERLALFEQYINENEVMRNKLAVLKTYIEAVQSENYEQTMLWTEDEGEESLARLVLLNMIKNSKIGHRFIEGGVVLFNSQPIKT